MRSPTPFPGEDRSLPTRRAPERLTEQALRESIGLPLAAMRVSMETLCDRLPSGTREARVTQALLAALTRITDDLETIVEYLSTPSPRPLPCTVAEILSSTRTRLGARGSSLEVACSCALDTLLVDGPILVRLLTRLLATAMEDSADPALLSVREARGTLVFAVVHSTSKENAAPDRPLQRIQRHLARREAALLGAGIGVQAGIGEQVITLLALPLDSVRPGAIAA